MQLLQLLASAALLAGSVQAHVRLTALNGDTGCVRFPPNNSPVTDVTSNDIICNVGGATPAATVHTVAAGSNVTVAWEAGAHHGPELIYLAKVDNAKTTAITGLSWFKIYQAGLMGSDLHWASAEVDAAGGLLEFTIPAGIAGGQYLLRGETIGLHVASSYPGAQFYMSCVQINVTGGGSATPAGVSFPGAYVGSDPAITINIYYPAITTYTPPGPGVYSG
ncbi:glycoside hydrolase [Morchella snyderi]|nr:glycoside hydrolase [Morchella snyderi]